MKQLSLQQVEYLAHKTASELMNFDEPIPPFSTRFPGILESCLAQPFQGFGNEELYPTIVDKASILFYLITKNHPFENGNKRMAVSTTLLFLFVNDFWLDIGPIELYEIAISVARSKPTDKEKILIELKKSISKHVVKRARLSAI